MFNEGMLIGFYWGPRRDGGKKCVEHCFQFLNGLNRIDHRLFSSWYQSFDCDERPLDVVSCTRDQIRELLISSVKTDKSHRPIEDLGYTLDLLSSQNARSLVQLSIQCDVTVPQLGGHCLLKATPGTIPYVELTKTSRLLDICRLIVNCWVPDDGVVSCHSLADAVEPQRLRFNSGWIIYRSAAHGSLSQLPNSARVEHSDDAGYLVVASEEITIPPSAGATEDVRAVFEVLGPAPKLIHN